MLPAAKAGRFRVATGAAQIIKEMGFNDEIGYNNFLYPSEVDTRKLLSFLIDKVPKVDKSDESSRAGAAAVSSLATLIADAMSQFARKKASILVSPIRKDHETLRPVTACTLEPPNPSLTSSSLSSVAGYKQYVSQYQRPLPSQPSVRSYLAPSVFEMNAKDAVAAEESARNMDSAVLKRKADAKALLASTVSAAFRTAVAAGAARQQRADTNLLDAKKWSSAYKESTAFSRRTDFTQEKSEVEQAPGMSKEELDARERAEQEELMKAREAELAALQAKLDELLAEAKARERRTEQAMMHARQVESSLMAAEAKAKDMEASYKVRRRVLDLLPNASENVAQLQKLADDNAAKILGLSQEWETVRAPLIAVYRKKKLQLNDRKAAIAAKADQIRKMRKEIKEKVGAVKEKEELYLQALAELNALPKSINRQVYIRRISDIVRNLEKQKEEIKRILENVRSTQREINVKGESVKRSFDVADDLVYQVAKVQKDPTASRVYRYIVTIQKGFADIIDTVELTGKTSNDTRELQTQIDTLDARNNTLNAAQVAADLEQVRKENKEMKEKLKKLKRAEDDTEE